MASGGSCRLAPLPKVISFTRIARQRPGAGIPSHFSKRTDFWQTVYGEVGEAVFFLGAGSDVVDDEGAAVGGFLVTDD